MDDAQQPSKSQRKRDADALKQLGVALIDLSEDKLKQLPLPDGLHQAIMEAKAIKSHGAKRRQVQLIGKLMRVADSDAIREAYEQFVAVNNAQTAAFHELEQWRDRLMHEGNAALTAFIAHYQPGEVQQLRQLIKKAVQDEKNNANTGASRALFRFLRACIS